MLKTANKKVESDKIKNELERIKLRIQQDNISENDISKVKDRYDIKHIQEISPALLVTIANSMATQAFKDEQTDGEDYKRYKREIDKAFMTHNEDELGTINKLMIPTISIANEIVVILNNYKKDRDDVIKNFNERTENIWKRLPDLSKTWKNVSVKLSALGISGSFWSEVYSKLKEVFEPFTSISTATIVAAGIFVFVDKVFLKMVGETMRIIDHGITRLKLYLIEKRYIRLKKRELEALAAISKEQLELASVECSEVDKKLIKKLCGTLPK